MMNFSHSLNAPFKLSSMLRIRKNQFQLKALPLPCLIIFRPPISCPLFPSSHVFSSLLFSHSLSGRAICEGPVQHNSAPAETSGSSGYNSEWLSISSGRLIRMRNCMSVSSFVPMVPPACGSTTCGPFLCWHSFCMFSGCLCMAGAAHGYWCLRWKAVT